MSVVGYIESMVGLVTAKLLNTAHLCKPVPYIASHYPLSAKNAKNRPKKRLSQIVHVNKC